LLSTQLLSNNNVSSQNAAALVKGRSESGYDYVGYIISDKQKVCAATLLDKSTILTAGHCLSYTAGESFVFGTGKFSTNKDLLVKIVLVKFAPGFDPQTNQGPDLAIAKLSQPVRASTYPTIGQVSENCEASIVAYGSGVQSGSAPIDYFKKKSGEGCVRAITNNFLVQFSSSVGICFGDSGGPVFKNNGSNEIIGVLSGGIIDQKLDTLLCDPGNTAFVVNVNNYSKFIKNYNKSESFTDNFRIISHSAEKSYEVDLTKLTSSSYSNEPLTTTNSAPPQLNISIIFYIIFSGILIVGIIIIVRQSKH
jgi:hypothetical protein